MVEKGYSWLLSESPSRSDGIIYCCNVAPKMIIVGWLCDHLGDPTANSLVLVVCWSKKIIAIWYIIYHLQVKHTDVNQNWYSVPNNDSKGNLWRKQTKQTLLPRTKDLGKFGQPLPSTWFARLISSLNILVNFINRATATNHILSVRPL